MRDSIDLVERIYSLTGNERQWLGQLAETFRPRLDRGHGVLANTYDANPSDQIAIRATALCDMDPALFEARSQVELPESERRFLLPVLRIGFVETLRHAPAALRRSGLPEKRVREYELRLEEGLRVWNLVDEFWVNAQDPTYFGCCFIAPSTTQTRWRPREAGQWRSIAAHVSAAFRIRRHFGSATGATPESFLPEAILRPDGRLEHAAPPAQGGAGRRAALRRAVLALDRARGPLRHRDPEQALSLWRALVAGRWSLVDDFDSDGRRFVVAHRNDAKVSDLRGLTSRERQIAGYEALGHSNKVIAYQLGLSVGTVGEHLVCAREKLRVLDRAAPRERRRVEVHTLGAEHLRPTSRQRRIVR